MFIEYLKRHRTALATKWAISLVAVTLLFLIIVGGILLDPLLHAALFTFVLLITPTGFSFLLFAALLLSASLSVALWFGIDYRIHSSHHALTPEDHRRWDETIPLEIEPPLPEATHTMQTKEQTIIFLEEDDKTSDEEEQKDTDVDDPIAWFRQQAQTTLQTLRDATLPPSADEQASMNTQLNHLRKDYYRLARKYHPDTVIDENEKRLKTTDFKQLSGIYEAVQKECHILKERIEQSIQPSTTQLYQEQNELLRETVDLLQQRNNLLRETNELLKAYSIMLEQQMADYQKIDKKIQKLKRKVVIIKQKLGENEKNFDAKVDTLKKETKIKFQQLKEEFLSRREGNRKETNETEVEATLPGETRQCLLF